MRITNNRIFISRGETPTYKAVFIDKDTGNPFVIPERFNNPYIEFVVRQTGYSIEQKPLMDYFLTVSNIHTFNNPKPLVHEGTWDNDAPPEEEVADRLFVSSIVSTDYRYYDADAEYLPEVYAREDDPDYYTEDNYKWVPYEFRIEFAFPRQDTVNLENKTYKYEVVLISGAENEDAEDGECPIFVDQKIVLLTPTDFVIGGSLSE